MRLLRTLALAAVVAFSFSVASAEDFKSGPKEKVGGPFDVKAITGEKAGTTPLLLLQVQRRSQARGRHDLHPKGRRQPRHRREGR